MILGRNVEQDEMSVTYKIENSGFLTLELSPFVLFEEDFMSAL